MTLMKKKIIESIDNILYNNYKTNINDELANNLTKKRTNLSKELHSKSSLLQVLNLLYQIEQLIIHEQQNSSHFKDLVDKLLEMDCVFNRKFNIKNFLNNE